jgi:hypothetical protein
MRECIKVTQVLLDQYKKAKYHRNVCLYSKREIEAKYWEGYIDALSLVIETQ